MFSSRFRLIAGIGVLALIGTIAYYVLFLGQKEPAITTTPNQSQSDLIKPLVGITIPIVSTVNLPVTAPTNDTIPQPIEHPVLRQFVDKNAPNRLPNDFSALIPMLYSTAEIDAVLRLVHDHTDADNIRNEAINLLRRSQVPNLDRHLLTLLDAPNENERFRSYAVQHVGDIMVEYIQSDKIDAMSNSIIIRDRLVIGLSDRHSSVRRESLLALTLVREPKVAAVIRSGLKNPDLSADHDVFIRCAYDSNLSDLIPDIRPFAYSDQTPARIAAINVLAQWGDKQSKSAFEEAAKSSVIRIQRAGTLALKLLSEAEH